MWTYLPYGPFASLDEYVGWLNAVTQAADPMFHAIVDLNALVVRPILTRRIAADDDRDPSPSQGAHHHHDGPSLLGLVTDMAMASPWAASAAPWPGRGASLASAETSQFHIIHEQVVK